MKFGKNLANKQVRYPHLRFIDYKGLKKILSHTESGAPDVEFFNRLNEEIDAVNDCFSSEVREIQSLLGGIVDQRSFADEHHSTTVEQLSEVIRIAERVEVLRRFAVWNAVGVVKILKKRLKVRAMSSTVSSPTTTEDWLSKQLFFSGSDFSEIQATLDSLASDLAKERLVQLSTKLSPELQVEAQAMKLFFSASQNEERCPICLERCVDAVELSNCGHRFCWKCVVLGPIAFAPGEYRLSKCAVCRNEQPLDPTKNFKSIGNFSQDMFEALTRLLDLDLTASEEGDGRDLVRQSGRTESCLEDLYATSSGVGVVQSNEEKARHLLHSIEHDEESLSNISFFCSLCCEPLLLEAITTTPCKHHFHRVCLEKYEKLQCPLCDEPLPPMLVVPLYKQRMMEHADWRICCCTDNSNAQYNNGQYNNWPCNQCGMWRMVGYSTPYEVPPPMLPAEGSSVDPKPAEPAAHVPSRPTLLFNKLGQSISLFPDTLIAHKKVLSTSFNILD